MTKLLALALSLALLPGPAAGQDTAILPPLKDLRGRTVRPADFRGKVVLVNFWATWCPPCRAETPDLVELQRRHGPEGLQVIGVACPPYTRPDVNRFVRSARVNYPVLLGSEGLAKRVTGTDTLPVTLVVDREGRVVDTIEGILTPEEVDSKVLPVLRGARPAAGAPPRALGSPAGARWTSQGMVRGDDVSSGAGRARAARRRSSRAAGLRAARREGARRACPGSSG